MSCMALGMRPHTGCGRMSWRLRRGCGIDSGTCHMSRVLARVVAPW